MKNKRSLYLLGTRIDDLSVDEAKEYMRKMLDENKFSYIFTPNPEVGMMALKDNEFNNIINSSDLSLCDGIGIYLATKIKGKKIRNRLTGYDMSLYILEELNKRSGSIFLLGAKRGVAEKAAEEIKKTYPNVEVKGYRNGYFKGRHLGYKDSDEEKEVLAMINYCNPDVVFVGMGAPYQEKFIYFNRDNIKAKLAIANGGVIDVLSGNVTIAPAFIRKIGFEWLYRLIKEPKRIKRQIIIPKYMCKVLFKKNSVEEG